MTSTQTHTSTDETQAGRGGRKSASAYRTISEVSDELAVPQHVLRFWESKFSQVRPLKRGGGRRYYRPEDVVLLRRIQTLLYEEGYTIKGVQKLLREGGVNQARQDGWRDLERDGEGTPPPSQGDLLAEDVVEDEGSRLPSELRAELAGLLDELKRLRSLLRRARSDRDAT